jgi:hypothetical protein
MEIDSRDGVGQRIIEEETSQISLAQGGVSVPVMMTV